MSLAVNVKAMVSVLALSGLDSDVGMAINSTNTSAIEKQG